MNGSTAQTLHIAYTDWNGQQQNARQQDGQNKQGTKSQDKDGQAQKGQEKPDGQPGAQKQGQESQQSQQGQNGQPGQRLGRDVELGRHRLGFALQLEVARFKLRALALEALAIGFGGAKRLALGQQEVAREAVLDGDDVAHLAEASDALKKNYLHVRHSYLCQIVPPGLGGCPLCAARRRKPKDGSARPMMATTITTQPRNRIAR